MPDLLDILEVKKKKLEEERKKRKAEREKLLKEVRERKLLPINFPGFEGKIDLLIDGIRNLPNYNTLKGYIRENVIPEHPNIDYQELSVLTGVHPGVALVILYDLFNDQMEEELKQIEKEEYLFLKEILDS